MLLYFILGANLTYLVYYFRILLVFHSFIYVLYKYTLKL